MRNLYRCLLGALLLVGCLSSGWAQTVALEGLTDHGYAGLRFWVDINADGKDDYCQLTGGSGESLDCYLSDGTVFGPLQRFNNVGTGSAVGSIKWADVNGDGYVDFCRTSSVGPARFSVSAPVTCYLGPNFSSLQVRSTTMPSGSTGVQDWSNYFFVDINADNRSDLCYVATGSPSRLRCQLATDAGFTGDAAAWVSQAIDYGYTDWAHDFVDFNGDGTPDYCRVLHNGVVSCLLIKPTGFTTVDVASASMSMPSGSGGAAFVDINGDGNADYCRVVNQTVSCRLSDGKAWTGTDWTSTTLDPGDSAARFWIDINGDSLPDFCRVVGGTTLSCRLNKGMAFDTSQSTAGAFGWSNPFMNSDVTQSLGSTAGAGMTDGGRSFCDPVGSGINTFCRMVQRDTDTGQQYCHTGENGDICWPIIVNSWALIAGITDATLQVRQPLLTVFSDGLGAETHVTYLPMSSTSVYTHSPVAAGNGYPRAVVALTGRSPLVYESRVVRSSNQTPLSGTARYFYKDLRTDTINGSLGFRDRWIFSEAANSLEHIVNFQGLGPAIDATSIQYDWREIGQVKYRERFAVANGLLPAPTNVGSLSNRQATLNVIGASARTLGSVTIGTPSQASPFILLEATTNSLAETSPKNTRYRYIGDSITRSWDWNGSSTIELPKSETRTTMDDVGNILTLVQTTMLPDDTIWRRVTTTNTYQDTPSSWLLGRLSGSTVTTQAASADDQLNLYARSAGRSPNAAATSSNVPAAPGLFSMPALMSIISTLLLDD